MIAFKTLALAFSIAFLSACSGGNDETSGNTTPTTPTTPASRTIRYLALGDSYTIGESVCESCRFPNIVRENLATMIQANYELKIIAQTGWTTANLKSAIIAEKPNNDYDLVTLLIGVNNQYQHKSFAMYEQEFPELLNMAIMMGKGDKNNVIVVSIPDYAYTPYGQSSSNPTMTSEEIDHYNAFAKSYAEQKGIVFVNITDITRQGLVNTQLVASDGLHPSQLAHTQFAEKITPFAMATLKE